MKLLIAAVLATSLPLGVLAQAPAKPAAAPAKPAAAAKPAAKAAAKPAAKTVAKKADKPVSVKQVPPASRRQAIEEATPLEEPDPSIKLSEADLAVARNVHQGEIPCELGAKVSIKPLRREGFFLVQHKLTRFVMHPVDSRTGAVRLEDPARGAMWLQIGNKSMLMNQRLGQRLADECQSPAQALVAADMKTRPAVNLLESAPAPVAPQAQTDAVAAPTQVQAPAAPAAPAAPTQ